jgi:GNAT superfamily N-acetyltransferase
MQIRAAFEMLNPVPVTRCGNERLQASPCAIDSPAPTQFSHFPSIRELHPSDRLACEQFFGKLDRHHIRMRFASPGASSVDLFFPGAGKRAEGTALAAVDGADTILGIVNLLPVGFGSAEFAVIVRSDHTRRGIGRSLIEHVVQRAARDGFSHLLGYVLAENRPMLALAEEMRFQKLRWHGLFVVVSRRLPSTAV